MPDAPPTPRPLLTRTFPAPALDLLRQAGFACDTISKNPERIRVMKGEVAAVFERQGGSLRLAEPPGYVFRGEIGRLWDAGYQKFWLLGPPTEEPFNETRRPAIAEQLRALHDFQEEFKYLLGVPSFYNESIGTTSEVTAYDRVQGLPAARQGRGPSVPTPSH